MTEDERNKRLRGLPSVDRVIAALPQDAPASIIAHAARQVVDRAREQLLQTDSAVDFDQIVASARSLIEKHNRSLLSEVINATGVVIHTNLGRAPLGIRQLNAVRTVAGGYVNLEYDLEKGKRGNRYSHAGALITAMTGAEAALVVNNNAAAVLLLLSALCRGREVIISRGELIEIGGEFRIPDIMKTSGAILREVGTTNRTHLEDYERAITPDTAAIMKVHPSNYRMVGFTAEVTTRELARLARGRGVLLLNDLGSGLTIEPRIAALRSEPLVQDAVATGADIVTFSGDKLLGGPQAGIIVGRSDLVDRLAMHPLLRALRVDKLTLAALEATLRAYLEDDAGALPVWQMLHASSEDLHTRALRIAAAIDGTKDAKAEAIAIASVTGGGSAPAAELDSWGVDVNHPERGASALAAALRASDPPIIGRTENDKTIIDLRTVLPRDDDRLIAGIVDALRRVGDLG